MNKEVFAQRLKQRLSEIEMKQSDFARACDMAPAIVTDYLKQRYVPKKDRLELMAKILGVSADWLGGDSDNKKRLAPQSAIDAGVATNIGAVRIPVLSEIAAGAPIEAMNYIMDDADPSTWEEIPAEWLHADKEFFALKVSGDSMEPQIPDGTIAIIERCYEFIDNRIMAVYVNGYTATLKRVRLKDNGMIVLEAFNPTYGAQIFTAEEVESLPVRPCGLLKETRMSW